MSQSQRHASEIAAPVAGGVVGIGIGAVISVVFRDYRALWFIYGLSAGLFVGALGAYLRFVWPDERNDHS